MHALEIGTLVAMIVWWVFVVWYGVRATWWNNRYGRNMMGVGFNVAGIWTLLYLLLHHGWQSWHLWPWLFIIVNMIILGAIRTYYMEKIQRGKRTDSGH